LDGSERMDQIVRTGLCWDVMGGVARRNWARNPNAMHTSKDWNEKHKDEGHITIPFEADPELISEQVKKIFGE